MGRTGKALTGSGDWAADDGTIAIEASPAAKTMLRQRIAVSPRGLIADLEIRLNMKFLTETLLALLK
ncbi:MAG TPA: hypothetical protein VHV08_04260 [Pirellulales bacterium]|nr:hypothetical protein [Pirellulales bacterium]